MRIALINCGGELMELSILAWRAFKEANIECQVFDDVSKAKEYSEHVIEFCVHEKMINKYFGDAKNCDRELKSVKDESWAGVETQYGENELLAKCLHKELMISLTEENPLWTEFRKDRSQFIKPKDHGLHKTENMHIKMFLYNTHSVKDKKRFEKNKMRVIRGMVHAVSTYMLLSK